MRVINYPKRGIGNSTLDNLSQYASEKEITLWQSLRECPLPKKARSTLLAFTKLIEGFAKKATDLNAFEVATYISARSGIIDTLRVDNSIEGLSRLENITALLDGIKEFCENDEALEIDQPDDKSLASYLQNIALVTDLDENSEDRDFVTLMSVHSAKGLEFDSVFVAGMEENIFPSIQALDEKDGIDEERRLFYVAITRARKYLTLSFAGSRYRFGKIVYNQPSRFIEEISEELMDSAIARRPAAEPVRLRASVQGNFNQKSSSQKSVEIPADFTPAPAHTIAAGMRVRHLRFGEGKVLSVDGHNDSKVATIFFQGVTNPQRRIMLKFAKLHIVE